MIDAAAIYVVVAIIGIVLVSLRFRRWYGPVLGLCYLCFAVLTIMFPQIEDAPGWKLYRLLYIVLVIVSVIHTFRDMKAPPVLNNQIRWMPFIAAFGALCLSAVYAHPGDLDIWDANNGLVGRLVVVGLYWIGVTQLRTGKDLRYFIRATILCGLSISAWVIQSAWHSGFSERGGLSVNQILVVDFIAIGAIPLIDLYFACSESLGKRMAQVGIVISLYGVFLTGSRGAALGIVLAAIVIGRRHGRGKSWKDIVRAMSRVAVLCGFVLLLPGKDNVLERILTTGETSQTSEARTMAVWPFLLNELSNRDAQKWLIGDGMNSSSSLLRATFNLGSTDLGWDDAHNMYLQEVCDRGLIGLALFVGFLYSVKRGIPQAPSHYIGLFSGWFVYLVVVGMFEVEANGKPFWMLLGVIVGSRALRESVTPSAGYVQGLVLTSKELPGIGPIQGSANG